jgi:hypothetical protein
MFDLFVDIAEVTQIYMLLREPALTLQAGVLPDVQFLHYRGPRSRALL